MKTKPTKSDPANIPREYTAETVIGHMIEGKFSWNEYCEVHASSMILLYPDKNSRTIDVWEVEHALREYRCHACNRKLWFIE